MRDEFKVDEISVLENFTHRDRKLRPSFAPQEPPEPAPAPKEVPEPVPATSVAAESESVKETEVPHEEPKRRRGKTQAEPQDYKSLFVKEVAGSKARVNKVVYIRKEHHDRILKVVQIIGKNEVSLFSFLDNLLEHHFSTWQGELTELYESSIDKSF
jgi:hypothetical protein